MIICWNCTDHQLDGTIFCDICGASLLDEAPRHIAAPLEERAVGAGHAAGICPRIILVDTGVAINLPTAPMVVVGRTGVAGPTPDVDLSQYRAAAAGVSRAHIVIDLSGTRPQITDLASTNGTYVNGTRLQPHSPIPLTMGDQIYLGQLALRLEL